MNKTLLTCLVGLALAGCDAPSQSDAAASAPAHERTLSLAEVDGGTTITATRKVPGGVQVAVSKVDSAISSGIFSTDVTFEACGRVKVFIVPTKANTVGIVHSGRGNTRDCKITNWDGEWIITQ
ncbi:hypothetical protein [Pseudomonas sp. 2FE]|uniref:hypothetical protein n=1 Tax=Pseudomonas sp. 2FE TaxID=2502190 RepID=UPI0010FA213C|nr:hypothetical protein [Pseudomonas sp. 2FE]